MSRLYFTNPEAIDRLYPHINALLEPWRQPGAEARLLGPVEIKHALHQALLHDAFYLMPLVLVAGMLVVWYFLRSWWLVLAGSCSIIVALWLTAGIVGRLGMVINQTSALAFCIAFIISLADVIHLQMSFTHQDPALSRQQAMLRALRSNLMALFLTSLTTGIGFLSLNAAVRRCLPPLAISPPSVWPAPLSAPSALPRCWRCCGPPGPGNSIRICSSA
ncbi:MAG: hypothetical protein SV765_09010 [Pseudomonadota bacterium]|nr:hypothetical protein [Pseudomonadota bacterium]